MVRCLSVLIKVYMYNSKLRVHVHCTPRFFCARILVKGQIGKPGAHIVNKSSYRASNGGVHRALPSDPRHRVLLLFTVRYNSEQQIKGFDICPIKSPTQLAGDYLGS